MPFQYYEISTFKVMLFAFKAFKPQKQGFLGSWEFGLTHLPSILVI
jgi:hypothetical protein